MDLLKLLALLLAHWDDVTQLVGFHVALPDHVISKVLGLLRVCHLPLD